jgi:hypothetical protein
LAAAALLVVSVITMAGSVSAQSGPSANCGGASTTGFGSDYYGFGDFGNRLLSTSTITRDFALTSPLQPGTYVLDAVSYDGYPGREMLDPQPREQWYAELLSVDGSVLATSGVTGDLEDGVDEATWYGNLGEVTIDQAATVVRVHHASPGSISVNSVRPVCLGATNTAVPDSALVVDFDSTAGSGSDVVVACGDLEESATGTMVDLLIEGIPAASGCVVEYPDDLVCSVEVAPASTEGQSSPGVVNIAIPDSGDASILVDIDCAPAAIDAPATTTTTIPTTTTAPPTEVAGQVENAPTAQVQPGTPSFTG